MTTATISSIESAIDQYLRMERCARSDLIARLSACLGKAEREYADFLDVMDTESVRKAYKALSELRTFINVREYGCPVSEKGKKGLIGELMDLSDDSYTDAEE